MVPYVLHYALDTDSRGVSNHDPSEFSPAGAAHNLSVFSMHGPVKWRPLSGIFHAACFICDSVDLRLAACSTKFELTAEALGALNPGLDCASLPPVGTPVCIGDLLAYCSTTVRFWTGHVTLHEDTDVMLMTAEIGYQNRSTSGWLASEFFTCARTSTRTPSHSADRNLSFLSATTQRVTPPISSLDQAALLDTGLFYSCKLEANAT